MSDQQFGFAKAPDRYQRNERETIDLIRDSMTDEQFVAFCWAQVIRYYDRAGPKGPAHVDETKAWFYECMARHVSDPRHPDPRLHRLDFRPYVRQPYPNGLHGLPRVRS